MFEQKKCDRVSIGFEAQPRHVLDQGIGVNWHQNWRSKSAPRDSAPPMSETGKWRKLMDELEFARPNCIRFGYSAARFCDERGGFDWNAEGFQALKMIDDYAVKHDARIVFDPWNIPAAWSFGKGADGVFYDAPRDIPAFIGGFVMPLLEHLLNEMKLKTLEAFILMNEPLKGGSGCFLTPPPIDRFEHYIECHKAIFEAAAARGLNIRLIGPDTWSMASWAVDDFNNRGLDLSPWIYAYDQHNYYGRLDYLPPNPTAAATMPVSDLVNNVAARNAEFARSKGKRYYLTEFGTFYYGWRQGDIYGGSTHEAFITEAETIIRAICAGCGGIYRWCFLAPGEYGDGVWQFINTVDESYTRQPHTFYGYASLMRYTGRGAAVFPGAVKQVMTPYAHVHAAALEMPDKTRTALAVNDHNCEERVADIRLPEGWAEGHWQRILCDRTRKMLRRDIVPAGGLIEDCLPPMSLAVYTTRRLPDDDALSPDNGVVSQA